jgi:hypothetical protein
VPKPGLEFVSFVHIEVLERLRLPDEFAEAVVQEDSGHDYPREAGAR